MQIYALKDTYQLRRMASTLRMRTTISPPALAVTGIVYSLRVAAPSPPPPPQTEEKQRERELPLFVFPLSGRKGGGGGAATPRLSVYI